MEKRHLYAAILAVVSLCTAVDGDHIAVMPHAYAQATSSCFDQQTTQLSFTNATLILGTNLQVGAVYQFSDIIGDGSTNGLIEVINFANGASLNVIDTGAPNPGHFQPELNAALNVDSGVDFRVSFVDATTGDPAFLDIAINSIDVDGNGDPEGGGGAGDLREYVEYETTLNTFVLNNPTDLDVNESGPSAGDRIRFEARTTQFAPGIDPTISENIVAGLYTNVSSFEFRIGALQAGAGALGAANTRITSLGFSCPAQDFQDNGDETPTSTPALSVTKAASPNTDVQVGQTVTYTYEVTNNGDVTLTDINLTDSHGGSGTFPDPGSETLISDAVPTGDSVDPGGANGIWDILAPGDVVRFTSSYIVTQEDIDTLQ